MYYAYAQGRAAAPLSFNQERVSSRSLRFKIAAEADRDCDSDCDTDSDAEYGH